MKRFALISTCLAMMSSCAPAINPIPSSANAGPGTNLMIPYDAAIIFADTCLIRGKNFDDYVEGLRVHNVTRNANTGTYYHNTANLSVRIAGDQCSLVFATDQDPDSAVSELARGTASMVAGPVQRGIDITSRVEADGLRYFRLSIQSPIQ